MEHNPILEQENYFKPYQDNIDALKNKPQVIEFDKLCYEIFVLNKSGQAFIELIKKRYLLNALCARGSNTYQIDVLWQEGFKDAFRMIINAGESHEQRIKSEMS